MSKSYSNLLLVFLFKSCILSELCCFLFTHCEGQSEGKKSGEKTGEMTNLVADFRGKSVKKNELEDTDDLLQSCVPTVIKGKGRLKQHPTIIKKKPNMVNSKVCAVSECEGSG